MLSSNSQIVVDPAGPALDLYVPVEVVIGSIPLAPIAQQYGMILPPLPSAPPQGEAPPGMPMGLYSDAVMPTSLRKCLFFSYTVYKTLV